MEHLDAGPYFHSAYRRYEIFVKPLPAGVQYLAYGRSDIEPAARADTLPEVMEKIDRLSKRRAAAEAEKCCGNCGNHLGGGACRLNLEADCGKGCFEAWEPARDHRGSAQMIVEV